MRNRDMLGKADSTQVLLQRTSKFRGIKIKSYLFLARAVHNQNIWKQLPITKGLTRTWMKRA